MRYLIIVLAMLVVTGCMDPYKFEDSRFVGLNSSNDNIVIVVDSTEFAVSANKSLEFVVKVPIPRNRVGDEYGPSSIDKITRVSVAIRNLRTGQLLPSTTCEAGAKVRTFVRYESAFQNVRCDYSY